MENRKIRVAAAMLLALAATVSCSPQKEKVWGWVSGSLTMPDEKLEHYFSKCKEVGIDAIIMECHGGFGQYNF